MRTSELTADVGLRARVLRDLASAERLRAEWSDLWSRCSHATTFQRPEWLLAWMRSFEPSHPFLIEVRRSDQLVGLAPLLVYQKGSERVLALMGGGVSDYLDILVDPDFADETLAVIWNHIQQEPEWTMLDLTDLPGTSPLLHTWPDDFSFSKSAHDVCSGLTMSSRADDLKKLFPFRQLRKRWSRSGKPGVLADPAIQSFHEVAAPQLLERGVLRLYGLRLNGRIIASLYTLFERDTACFYLQGFDPDYARFSPGTQLLGSVIADAVREDKHRIDFLRGREPYKQHWGAAESSTFRVQASRIP